MKRGRPRATNPKRHRSIRLGPVDEAAVKRIMQAKGLRDPAKAMREAIHAYDGLISGVYRAPAPAAPPEDKAPAVVRAPHPKRVPPSPPPPERAELVEPCPRCGRLLPKRVHNKSHHPTGNVQDIGLARCEPEAAP